MQQSKWLNLNLSLYPDTQPDLFHEFFKPDPLSNALSDSIKFQTPTSATGLLYSCLSATSQRTHNDKDRDTNQLPLRVDPSEALFEGWQRRANAVGVPTNTLNSIWPRMIINTRTLLVAEEAIRMEYGSNADPNREYEFTPLSTGFWALLGTANGGTVLHMLMDHSLALGRQKVEKIKVYPKIVGNVFGARNIAFFLSPALPPPPPKPKPGKRSVAGQRRREKRASGQHLSVASGLVGPS
jgi:hypothetical protein